MGNSSLTTTIRMARLTAIDHAGVARTIDAYAHTGGLELRTNLHEWNLPNALERDLLAEESIVLDPDNTGSRTPAERLLTHIIHRDHLVVDREYTTSRYNRWGEAAHIRSDDTPERWRVDLYYQAKTARRIATFPERRELWERDQAAGRPTECECPDTETTATTYKCYQCGALVPSAAA